MIDRMPKERLSGFDCTEQNVDCFLPLQNCTSTATAADAAALYVLPCVLCVGGGGRGPVDWERARCEAGGVDGDGNGNGMVVVKTTRWMCVCVWFGCGDGDGGRGGISSSHITISLLFYHSLVPFRVVSL